MDLCCPPPSRITTSITASRKTGVTQLTSPKNWDSDREGSKSPLENNHTKLPFRSKIAVGNFSSAMVLIWQGGLPFWGACWFELSNIDME